VDIAACAAGIDKRPCHIRRDGACSGAHAACKSRDLIDRLSFHLNPDQERADLGIGRIRKDACDGTLCLFYAQVSSFAYEVYLPWILQQVPSV
jgi:hypothetical protein